MRRTRLAMLAGVLLAAPPPAANAQTSFPTAAPGVKAPGTVPLWCDRSGRNCQPVTPALPLPTAGKQEAFLLASGNVAGSDQSAAAPAGGGVFAPAASTSVYGGGYAFTQVCSGYGTASLQVWFAPGAAWLTVASRTAADTAPASVQLASNALVRVLLSGTTGCAATLERVPS